MDNELTEIVIVLDRSGSMNACKNDMEGGLNEFVDEQKKVPGRANLTLVQFDTEYEFIHRSKAIETVGHIPLQPRGMTALLDAVGRAVSEVKEAHDKLVEDRKPAKTVVMVITDGYENSSREYTKQQVKALVTERQAAGWQFVFLGADVDAFAEAGGIGVQMSQTADFVKTAGGIKAAYGATGQNVAAFRSGTSSNVAYTQAQKDSMMDK